jgi:hypothetical protein
MRGIPQHRRGPQTQIDYEAASSPLNKPLLKPHHDGYDGMRTTSAPPQLHSHTLYGDVQRLHASLAALLENVQHLRPFATTLPHNNDTIRYDVTTRNTIQ